MSENFESNYLSKESNAVQVKQQSKILPPPFQFPHCKFKQNIKINFLVLINTNILLFFNLHFSNLLLIK